MNPDFLVCRNVRVLFGWKFFFLYFWVNSYDTFMITKEQVEIFVTQAHRYGEARLMLCSSGNLSWRVGDKMLVSGTGSWLPVLPPEKVAVCDIISGQGGKRGTSFHGKCFSFGDFQESSGCECGVAFSIGICHGGGLHEK